jgi:hypothetical protein
METIAGQAIEPRPTRDDDGMELVADDDPVLVATSMLDAAPEPSEPSHEDDRRSAGRLRARRRSTIQRRTIRRRARPTAAPVDDDRWNQARPSAIRRRSRSGTSSPSPSSPPSEPSHEWAAPTTEPTLAILDAIHRLAHEERRRERRTARR